MEQSTGWSVRFKEACRGCVSFGGVCWCFGEETNGNWGRIRLKKLFGTLWILVFAYSRANKSTI
jgi:hypothetical protein